MLTLNIGLWILAIDGVGRGALIAEFIVFLVCAHFVGSVLPKSPEPNPCAPEVGIVLRHLLFSEAIAICLVHEGLGLANKWKLIITKSICNKIKRRKILV